MWYNNTAGKFFGSVTKHACDGETDGQTDRQNYDSQDRASIASRGKKWDEVSSFSSLHARCVDDGNMTCRV